MESCDLHFHFHAFSGWGTSRSFESSFLMKCFIITVLNFFMERFVQYLKKSKNGFPIVFSKCDLAFFLRNFFLNKPNIPKYAQDLVVTWVKPNSITDLLYPLILPLDLNPCSTLTGFSKRSKIGGVEF